MVVPHSEKRVHSFSINLWVVQAISLALVVVGLSLLVFANQYQDMWYAMRELDELRAVNREQRDQIRQLVAEAGIVRENMVRLTELDRQLRELLSADKDFAKVKPLSPLVPVPTGPVAGSSGAAGGNTSFRPGDPVVVTVASADSRAAIVSRGSADRGAQLSLDLAAVTAEMAVREQSLEELRDDLTERLAYEAAKPSIPPVLGTITSYFGMRVSPFGWGWEFHSGLDIAARYGTPIVAAADGVVTFAGLDGDYGRTVQIDHGYGFQTMYGHTSKINVEVGQRVKRGEIIAWVGNTGLSSGPHLHYIVKLNGKLVDPLPYIRGSN